MKLDNAKWVGVEATKQGFPVLMRIRRITPQLSFKTLFVVVWSYPEDQAKRLPSAEFYAKIEHFERAAIDGMEQEPLGIYVASETGLGTTKYFIYTQAPESLAAFLNEQIDASEKVEFAASEDEGWHEYTRFARLIGE
jgi:hypothetical protein